MTIIDGESPWGGMLDIGAVERDTGVSKDVLRVWERRYGFPAPIRDAHGDRRYSAPDVAKLRAIKRLADAGMRPGALARRSIEELNLLGDRRDPVRGPPVAPAIVDAILGLLRRHDAPGLRHALADALMRQGLQPFVLETLTPLNRAVGEAWMRGELQIFEEHLYTEQVQFALRTAISAFPRRAGRPRVLMTTFPGERHGLGLLAVEALLVPEGAQCISLGVETPPDDIRRAASAHRADLVALSISGASPLPRAARQVAALRGLLPPTVTLWVGGAMAGRLRGDPPGTVLLTDLAAAVDALRRWRSDADARPAVVQSAFDATGDGHALS